MAVGKIVGFWQGVLACVLRCLTVVAPFGALVAAAVALSEINIMSDEAQDLINGDGDLDLSITSVFNITVTDDPPDTSDLVDVTQATTSIIIIATVAVLLFQLVMLTLHCIGACALNYINIAITEALVTILLVLIFLGFGATAAWTASEWDDWDEWWDDNEPEESDINDDFESLGEITSSMAATAAFSLLAAPVLIISALWTMVFYTKDWADKIGKYDS